MMHSLQPSTVTQSMNIRSEQADSNSHLYSYVLTRLAQGRGGGEARVEVSYLLSARTVIYQSGLWSASRCLEVHCTCSYCRGASSGFDCLFTLHRNALRNTCIVIPILLNTSQSTSSIIASKSSQIPLSTSKDGA